jgi:uroporphyrinogen-III decarboxylase
MEAVEAAIKVHKIKGFENYKVPFCMNIENESFHVEVDLGSKLVEPRRIKYNEDILYHLNKIKIEHSKRAIVVLEAISQLKNDEIPVIGNITGPMSIVGNNKV